MKSKPSYNEPNYKPVSTIKPGIRQSGGKYRPNVAICVLNPSNEVLLVWHREHVRHYWQFLQGGIGPEENLRQTVARELKEEVGLTHYNLIVLKEHVYRYPWPKKLIAEGTDPDKQGYIGQDQSIAIVRVHELRPKLKPDAREAAAVKWFAASSFMKALNPVRRSLGQLVVLELQKLGIPTV